MNPAQTTINDAYKYKTFCPYINNMKSATYSVVCVFCSHKESTPLMTDGSFRNCNRCKKQFKALVTNT